MEYQEQLAVVSLAVNAVTKVVAESLATSLVVYLVARVSQADKVKKMRVKLIIMVYLD